MFELRDQALQRLRATGSSPEDVRVLDKLVAPEDKAAPSTLEAIVRVEKLLDAGLAVGAREQLDAALKRYPSDPDLRALAVRVDEALSAVP